MEIKYEDWFYKTKESNIYVITDTQQKNIIESILDNIECRTVSYINIDESNYDYSHLEINDLLIVALSIKSFIKKKMNKVFSPFRKPEGLIGKYTFIRLDISEKSFREALLTEKKVIDNKVKNYMDLKPETRLRVTSKGGTDVTFAINRFFNGRHYLDEHNDIAFLPASEVYAGILLGSANGLIVVDVTVGQIEKENEFGLVQSPVELVIENSKIVSIKGAPELEKTIAKYGEYANVIVELGLGLSKMTPTGIIGIDESIYATCHFGFGDGELMKIDNSAPIHLDVVINEPEITVLK